jgi:ferrous iron transport protein A
MAFWGVLKPARSSPLPRARAAALAAVSQPAAARLDAVPTGQGCRVVALTAPADQPDWQRWLGEIGLLPGERVTVMARSAWGGDPLVVRIGPSTFALRRAEAACVHVEPL